jgi:glycosyltransferase involved in cell wall biosynthesis
VSRDVRVLALPALPEYAAATRYRILQYVPLLAELGIRTDVRPFVTNRTFAGLYDRGQAARTALGMLAGAGRRLVDAARLGSYDLVWVQTQAALIGPPIVEWLAHRRCALVLDLDDPTYLERRSSVFGAFASMLKGRGKADRIIRCCDHAVCGNPTVAAYIGGKGVPTTVLPTLVDTRRFTPRPAAALAKAGPPGDLVLGWMGTHSTFEYLLTLLPVFRRLAETHRFRLRVIGSGRADLRVDGVDIDMRPWALEREVEDLQSCDVAVYPIPADEWARGKSGFKAIQYLSCGIPYVASPVGIVASIGTPDVTHLEARSEDEWFDGLSRLLTDPALRDRIGKAGRRYAVEHYSTRTAAATLAGVFTTVADKRRSRRRPGERA